MALLPILFISGFGCGITGEWSSVDMSSVDNAHAKCRRTRIKELKMFIGMTKNEIKTRFGRPDIIRNNVKTIFSSQVYEEEWDYKREYGIPIIWPDEHYDIFYFSNNKVELVDVE